MSAAADTTSSTYTSPYMAYSYRMWHCQWRYLPSRVQAADFLQDETTATQVIDALAAVLADLSTGGSSSSPEEPARAGKVRPGLCLPVLNRRARSHSLAVAGCSRGGTLPPVCILKCSPEIVQIIAAERLDAAICVYRLEWYFDYYYIYNNQYGMFCAIRSSDAG